MQVVDDGVCQFLGKVMTARTKFSGHGGGVEDKLGGDIGDDIYPTKLRPIHLRFVNAGDLIMSAIYKKDYGADVLFIHGAQHRLMD